MKKSDQKLALLYLIIDFVVLNIAILLSLYLKYGLVRYQDRYKYFFIIYYAVWLIIILLQRNHLFYWRLNIKERFLQQFKLFFYHIGIVSFIIIILFKEFEFSRQTIYGAIALFFILRFITGSIVFYLIRKSRLKGKNLKMILVLGAGEVAHKLYQFIQKNQDLGYKIIGFLDDKPVDAHLNKYILGKLADLKKILSNRKVDEIIVALPITEEQKIKNALHISDFFGIRIRLIPDYYRLLGRSYNVRHFGNMPVINIREIPLDDIINYSLKRIFDILFSLVALIVLIPVYIFLVLLIWWDIRDSIIYAPVRVGMGGKKFKLYKFRTMLKNDDSDNGTMSTKKDDPRVTKIGSFLRKNNLDELLQFWNVLKGDMSVVGPRPHRIWLSKKMQQTIFCYMVRHYLRPGITGWAQVNGWRGTMETEEEHVQRTNHDIWYMENWSLLLDIKIILLTIFGKKVRQNAF